MSDLELLVSRLDAGLIRYDPHLDEVHRSLVLLADVQPPGVVLLRVQDPSARAHALCQARVDDACMTHRVLVHE